MIGQFNLTRFSFQEAYLSLIYSLVFLMKQLHPIQLKILKKLLFAPQLKYTELKPEEHIENNQLSFHLNTLISM
jgi:hypothetical protein